jgi:hypothetical protein
MGRSDFNHSPSNPNYSYYHYSPCVLRVRPDYFDKGNKEVIEGDGLLLGLSTSMTTPLPYDIAYELKAIAVEFTVAQRFASCRTFRCHIACTMRFTTRWVVATLHWVCRMVWPPSSRCRSRLRAGAGTPSRMR